MPAKTTYLARGPRGSTSRLTDADAAEALSDDGWEVTTLTRRSA